MRRIFGGTITSSSTSTSLASDALSSPETVNANGQARGNPFDQADALPQNGEGLGTYQDHSNNNNNNSNSSETTRPATKGWFGSLGQASGALVHSSSTGSGNETLSSLASLAGAFSGGVKNEDKGNNVGLTNRTTPYTVAQDGEVESTKLPFGSSRMGSKNGSIQRHVRGTGSSSSSRGLQPAYSVPSRDQSKGRPLSPASDTFSEGGVSAKEAMMVDLLSGQALLESKSYEVMNWDDVERIKKEHAQLASQIAILQRNLALETRLRDSSLKLARLSATSSSSNSNYSSPSSTAWTNNPSLARPSVTREQAEAQAKASEAKIETVSTEMYKLGWHEAQLRTKLLSHTAGVLGLDIRRRDRDQREIESRPLSSPKSSALAGFHTDASQDDHTNRNYSGNNGHKRVDSRFDGPHFFAGNREAIVPLGRSATSPFCSPRVGSPVAGAFTSFTHHEDTTVLHSQIDDLKRSLEQAQKESCRSRSLEQELEHMRDDLAMLSRAGESAQAEMAAKDRTIGQSSKEVADLQQQLVSAKQETHTVKSQWADVQQQHHNMKNEHETMRINSGDTDQLVKDLKQQITDLTNKLSIVRLDYTEVAHRSQSAEDKVQALEQEMDRLMEGHEVVLTGHEREKDDMRSQISQLSALSAKVDDQQSEREQSVRAELAKSHEEHARVALMIMNVLSRHRSSPAVAPILRDLPLFDESAPDRDFAQDLSSTVDSHLERISSHVSSLHANATQNLAIQEQQHTELERVRDEMERHHQEIDTLRQDRNLQQSARQILEEKLQTQDQHLQSRGLVDDQLTFAKTERDNLREQLNAAQVQITSFEQQLADTTRKQSDAFRTLRDVWLQIPPLEARAANSASSDLTTLKSAFSTPGHPLGSSSADAAASTFTVEALAIRIRSLLNEDGKLVQKILTAESEQGLRMEKAERTQRQLVETNATLEAHQKQVADLRERMEVSSSQEVTMLERVNDLTESLEQTRREKRKLEASAANHQTQIKTVEQELTTLKAKLSTTQIELTARSSQPMVDSKRFAEVENELQDMKDQLADAQEELGDAKRRETKQRSNLLDELSQVQQELSSVKTKLRQAERKAVKT